MKRLKITFERGDEGGMADGPIITRWISGDEHKLGSFGWEVLAFIEDVAPKHGLQVQADGQEASCPAKTS